MSASTYESMGRRIEQAIADLERLAVEVDDRHDAEVVREFDSSEDAPDPVDEATASAAVAALSSVFEVVKALAEDGQPLVLPTEPLPLTDAALVTILANAELARRGMVADLERITEQLAVRS